MFDKEELANNVSAASGLSKLSTPTFAECLQLIADGTSVTEAANLLGTTPDIVDDLLSDALQRLNAVNLLHAVAIGIRTRVID